MSILTVGALQAEILNLMNAALSEKVKKSFSGQCEQLEKLMKNDYSGLIKPLTQYAIDNASETKYTIVTQNSNLDKILNEWLSNLNDNFIGKFEVGVNGIAKEYFRERWQKSSLIVLRIQWKDYDGILLPSNMWLMDGSSIEMVQKNDSDARTLDNFIYYIDKSKKQVIPDNKYKSFLVQKPFNSWADTQITPYLVGSGALQHFLVLEQLVGKGQEALSRVLPYILALSVGSDTGKARGERITKAKLDDVRDAFRAFLDDYEANPREIPLSTLPYDAKLQHIFADLSKLFDKNIYEGSISRILSALGIIEIMQLSSTRAERILNPEPFIAEVNAGVKGFKDLLTDVIRMVIYKNQENHRVWFSTRNNIIIKNTPLRINVKQILDRIEKAYDKGVTTIKTYQEALQLDPDTEKIGRLQEEKEGDLITFYPRITVNRENQGIDVPERPERPIKEEMEEGKITNEEITAPYDKNSDLPDSVKVLPEDAKSLWREVFNKSYSKGEDYARKVAWTVVKKSYKKNKDGNWVKK